MKKLFWMSLFAGAVLFSPSLKAEMQNHYILGTNGINSAVKPPCGIGLTGIYSHYHANKIMGPDGRELDVGGSGHYNNNIVQVIASYYSQRCFLGGKYGCQLDVPFMGAAFDVAVLNQSFSNNTNMRLSDIYAEPLNVRWEWDRFNLFSAIGVYAPSGKFKPFSDNNTGLGNWGTMFTLAATMFFDCHRTFSFSAYATYEVHFKKRNINFRPGDNLCIDMGLGKKFGKYFTFGAAGYFERQTTRDHGSDVPYIFRNVRDHVWAAGPEFDVVIPQLNGQLSLRYLMEFEAASRMEGSSFFAILGFVF